MTTSNDWNGNKDLTKKNKSGGIFAHVKMSDIHDMFRDANTFSESFQTKAQWPEGKDKQEGQNFNKYKQYHRNR